VLAFTIVPVAHGQAVAFPSSGSLSGNGYAAVRLYYAGPDDLVVSITTRTCTAHCALAGTVIDPDGSTWGGVLMISGLAGNDDCVILSTQALGSVAHSCHESVAQRVFMTATGNGHPVDSTSFTINASSGDEVGTYTFLVWQAFEHDQQGPGAWSVSFKPGEAAILNETNGERAWYATARDFQGGSMAGASLAGAYANANAGSSWTVSVQNVLLGAAVTDGFDSTSPLGGLTFNGPLGPETCTCIFSDPSSATGVGNGAYEFDLTRAAAGVQSFSDLTIALVDPELPT
jgi:hypothetical protein